MVHVALSVSKIPSDGILETSTTAGGTTPPHARSFRPFALSFTADLDDPLPHTTPMDAAVGGFLAPPPLACLSALDEANAFVGPSSSFSDDDDEAMMMATKIPKYGFHPSVCHCVSRIIQLRRPSRNIWMPGFASTAEGTSPSSFI